jgi:transglutaminase-like putative cysteine protease
MLGPMRFAVRHETVYRYVEPVALAPHLLRLTPRAEYANQQRVLSVRPTPVDMREEHDPLGNLVTHVRFAAHPTEVLVIESQFQLDTESKPREAVSSGFGRLPWAGLPDEVLDRFKPASPVIDPEVVTFAEALAGEVGWRPLEFLDHLCRTMFARAERRIRPAGDAQPAIETLRTWQGACRDYATLFLAAVRSVGMPARFCSGYQATSETPDGRRYLHAWPEVFVPGAGWLGWDPTHGIPVEGGHVALCSAPEQAGTMPVTGSYFADHAVASTLDFSLTIEAV